MVQASIPGTTQGLAWQSQVIEMNFRWLGVAGIELISGNECLVIDPYITTAPFWKLFFGHVSPDGKLLRENLPCCNHLLVTHAHFDHVLDAAEVLCYSGAQGYGSSNACRLMMAAGAPEGSVHGITSGDHLECGPFLVDVHTQAHPFTPLNPWINGELAPDLEEPLKLMDYRMDEDLGFMITVQGLRISVGDLPIAADVLFTVPLKSRRYYTKLVSIVQPRLIIPIHWDNLFLPLAKNQSRSGALTRVRGLLVESLLMHFTRWVESIPCKTHSGGCRVLIPQVLQSYRLENELLPIQQKSSAGDRN